MGKKLKFGNRLKELRKEKGLTQIQLAEMLGGYNRTSISDWEIERKEPSFEVLVKLVEVLDTTADYLLGITDIE